MAEGDEIRHAAIGIDLDLNGMDQVQHINDSVDRLINSFKEVDEIAGGFRHSMENIGGNAASNINHARESVSGLRNSLDDAHRTMNSVSDATSRVRSGFDFIKGSADKANRAMKFDPNIVGLSHKMADIRGDFSKTEAKAKSFQKSLNFGKAGKFNISSGGISKSEDELKHFKSTLNMMPTDKVTKITGSFEKSGKAIKRGSGLMTSFSDHIDKARDRTKRFHNILWGSFVGNALSNGIQTVGSDLWQAAKGGFALVEGGKQIQMQWQNIGLSSKGAKEMTDQIGEIRGKTDMAGSAIDAMQKKFYAMTDSASKAKALTNEMAAYGSAAGKTGEQIQQLAMGVTRSLGSKKVSVGFFNRAFGQLPALQKQVEAASHMTNTAFQNALKAGKITGNELEGYMMKAAKGSSIEWAAFAKTTQGKIAGIKGTWQNMTAAFAKPVVAGVSKSIDALAKGKGGLTAVKKDLADISTSLGKHVGNAVGKAIQFIISERKPLGEIISDISSIGKGIVVGAWKMVSGAIKSISGKAGPASKGIGGLAKALGSIAKHKKAIEDVGKALVIAFAVKKIAAFVIWIPQVVKGIKAITLAVKGFDIASALNPWGLAALAVAALALALVHLYKHNKKFRKFVNDLAKAASKRFGEISKTVGKMYKSVTKYFTNLTKNVKKRWGNMWHDEIKVAQAAWRTIRRLIDIFVDDFTGNWSKMKKDVVKLAKSLWNDVKVFFKAGFDFINDLTDGRLSSMIKGFQNAWKEIGKGWHSFWDGIDSWFGNLWQGIVKHVQNGINDVIKVLNAGIGGIDSVIHMFGGSKSSIGKIGYVHFAEGTDGARRAITKPTMAILNDGHDSPETHNQEVVAHPNGMLEAIKGLNTPKLLEPHAEVIKASDARDLGLTTQHFAKGTGFVSKLFKGAENIGSGIAKGVKSGISAIGNFAGGVVKKTKQVFETVKGIVKNPGKYLSGLLGNRPSAKGPIMNDFAGGFFDKMKSSASNWWKSLWGMISLDGGSSKGSGSRGDFLQEAIKIGKGRRYSEGADRLGPNAYDCSGLVYTALKHLGITVSGGSTTVPEYHFTHPVSWSKARPGDLAFYGAGGTQHVGIVASTAGAGKMWNAENYHDGIKYGPIKGFGDFVGLRRISQLHDAVSKSSKHKGKQSGGIDKLIRKEVGGGFFKFIHKLVDKFTGGSGAMGNVNLAGDEAARAREIAKALKKAYPAATDAGIAGILGNWMQESRLSPSAIDAADHGTGLGQWTFSRETGLRNWLKKHGYKWNSAAGQLDYALHEPGESGAFKSVLRMSSPSAAARKFFAGWESGGNEDATGGTRISNAQAAYKAIKGHAKGGHINRNQLSVVGEKGCELFKPDHGGTVIPHEASTKLVKNAGSKHVSVSSPVKVTIQGNATDEKIEKLGKLLNNRDNDLVDKLSEALGFNDDGGLII